MLEFTEAGSALTYQGADAALVGASNIETNAGETLMLTPEATSVSPEWALQSTPSPSSSDGLFDVSCPSVGDCRSVGWTEGIHALSQFWNGAEWSTNSPPKLVLLGISCSSSSFCFASNTSLTTRHWNGSAWSNVTLATPGGAASRSLASIDCVSSSYCMAVGSYTVSGGASRILAESWNGSEWSVTKEAPAEEGGANSLKAVDCNSSKSCTAVGLVGGKRAALRSEGVAWEALGTPVSSSGAATDLSCGSSSSCTAVFGDSETEHWNGSEWSAATAATPAGGSSVALDSVSCGSSTACVAVGTYAIEGTSKTLVESWDGSEWSVQSTPQPEGAEASGLSGVSCPSAGRCTAVGYYETSGDVNTLAMRYE